jgi:hypothetical protein
MVDEIRVVRVKLTGPNFERDLEDLKSHVPVADRDWNDFLKVWNIFNPLKYMRVKCVKAAVEAARAQPRLIP